MKDLSILVRKRRGERGLRSAADEIGITHTTLSRVESGKLPDIKTFILICKWLGIDPNEILGFSDIKNSVRQSSVPVAHYRAKKTMSPATTKHLAELIVKVHEASISREL